MILTPKTQRFKIVRNIKQDLNIYPMRVVSLIHLHHTGGYPNALLLDSAERIDLVHKRREPKPFSQIGYHFVVLKNGLIQLGRPLEKQPASIKGHNMGAIAVVIVGNFSREKPPGFEDNQARAAGLLIAHLMDCFIVDLAFHKELAATECPGLFFQRQDVDNYLQHIQENFHRYYKWYNTHVELFNQFYPGFDYTSDF